MIVHIPHASTWIPPEERPLFLGEKLLREREVMTDWYCDELFARKGTGLVYPVSRLVCDPERFREDADEPMSAVGMGAPARLSGPSLTERGSACSVGIMTPTTKRWNGWSAGNWKSGVMR